MTVDDNRIIAIEDRLRKIELETAAYTVKQETISEDVKEVKDTMKWLVRLIIGAIILALIGYVTAGGLVLVP